MKRKSSKSEDTSMDPSTPSTNAPDCPPVTIGSPTPSSSTYQELEAMLAAVNSHGTSSLAHESLLAAAAAAAAAASAANAATTPSSAMNNSSQRQSIEDMDPVRKNSIRASNRERKKKWRLQNEERNKDNDLRCRVNKRATKIFGVADTSAKQNWIEDEFEKRRKKRMDKERRKGGAMSSPLQSPGVAGASDMYYQDLPQQILLEQLMAITNGSGNGKLLENLAQLQHGHLAPNQGAGSESLTTKKNQREDQADSSKDAMDVDKTASSSLAQALSTSTSTSSSGQNSPAQYTNQDKGEGGNSSQKAAENEDKNAEYPAEAILTLMNLNAGWQK